jgi:hypothetical protein
MIYYTQLYTISSLYNILFQLARARTYTRVSAVQKLLFNNLEEEEKIFFVLKEKASSHDIIGTKYY